ncbi:sterol carrier family protein [Thermomonospora umbrina]|nr:sterol carrier family protein [Thermomonospora umbrina]
MSRSPLTRAVLDERLAALGRAPYEGPDEPAALRLAALDLVLDTLDSDVEPGRPLLRAAVRVLLDRLAAAAPGRSVEVRIPPYAAVQCVAGPRHTRGTPPNVVETDADTWIRLATGRLGWAEAMREGRIRAGGPRADLSALLPVQPEQPEHPVP